MGEKKPWEEDWAVSPDVGGGAMVGQTMVVERTGQGHLGVVTKGVDRDYADAMRRLIAAAPALYRALAAVEFRGHDYFNECPMCRRSKPADEPGAHETDCALNAALSMARGET